MSHEHAKRIIALLYASADPLSAEHIQHLLQLSTHTFSRAIRDAETLLQDMPFTLYHDAQGYRLILKQAYASIAQLVNPQADLSRTALSLLALIAYTQPIMQSEVTRLMGNVYDTLKHLEERGFITRQKKGRSFEIRLGQAFYRYFEVPQGEEKDVLERLAEEHGITLPRQKREEGKESVRKEEEGEERTGSEEEKDRGEEEDKRGTGGEEGNGEKSEGREKEGGEEEKEREEKRDRGEEGDKRGEERRAGREEGGEGGENEEGDKERGKE